MERLQGVIRKEWSFHGGKIVFFVKSSQTQIVIRVFLVEKPRFNEFDYYWCTISMRMVGFFNSII